MRKLTFVVGDIHGCFSKLDSLTRYCVDYASNRQLMFVMLGDYIDRGDDSRDVVKRLMLQSEQNPNEMICLKGNHEAMLIIAQQNQEEMKWWIGNGGDRTLASYGISSLADFPPDHLAWIKRLPLCHDDGRRFFVHAGVDPTLPLDSQSEKTFLWTRKRYPESLSAGRFVVHGHTPSRSGKPELQKHRLNLDTGAVYGGPLTAAVFNDEHDLPVAFIDHLGEITELSH